MINAINVIKLAVFILFGSSVSSPSLAAEANEPMMSKAELGRLLYFDVILSKNRSQSCASCHDPSVGFVDRRKNATNGAVSLGDNLHSLGDRNAPTTSYAAYSPDFHKNALGEFIGGQFLDGRAKNLQEQAGGPPLNPGEMQMVSKTEVVKRFKTHPVYRKALVDLYGSKIFEDDENTYDAITESIAIFEKTPFFASFDSKYDRYLRGEYKPNLQEELGMTLFFSQQFTNCNQCHQLHKRPMARSETFSDYSYHNIGVPVNAEVRKLNGLGEKTRDEGLLANPLVTDTRQRGKFKVPTLRNVAVTGPYMHNGVFKDLRTVILFYNKYNTKSAARQINPETGQHWQSPEIDENISLEILKDAPALDDRRIDALIAFMNMLTDQRFEHLLPDNQISENQASLK